MALPAPEILLPTAGVDYATNITPQTISGKTVADTEKIHVNGSAIGVSYTKGETVWSWTGSLVSGDNPISVTAIEKTTGEISRPANITVALIEIGDFATVSPPTGVSTRRYQNRVEMITAANPEPQVIGYNFWVSTQSGGINNIYAKINTEVVTSYSFYEDRIEELGRTSDTTGEIRVTTITDEVTRHFFYSAFLTEARFNQLVTLGALPNVPFTQDTPFFFVATAVFYSSVSGQVTESTNSAELEATVVTITSGLSDLPARTQQDIILTYSREILLGNAGVDTKPGTVLRDIIDPISEEQARMYVIQDFMSSSLSVSTLLDFDDANNDTVSDPVADSPSKRSLQVALNFTESSDVQRLVDNQFDKLGANVNVPRNLAVNSTGTVIFYTTIPPIRDMIVNESSRVSTLGDLDEGIAAQSYTVLETKVIEYQNAEQWYNTRTRRYELEVGVEAVSAGDAGNTDSYTIKTIDAGADSSFLVENPNPVSFGVDIESNHDYAARIMLAFFVDTGTEGGYARTAINVPGVRNVRVEKAKDELMIRDWDPVREEHVGGKVDIYVQGHKVKQYTDQIAFSFESVATAGGAQSGEIFNVINAAAYQFKTENPRVTAHTPIFEVTRVHNATRGSDYDISNYQIIGDGDTVDLDETIPLNASIGLASADVIRVDYKYRSSDVFIMTHQPVDSIVSVTGQISGVLPSDNYELVKLQDPLEDGNSTIASDGIRIEFANDLPLTEFQTITNEEHVMVLGVNEPLDYLGADPVSIVATDEDSTVIYVQNVDYTVDPGTETQRTTLRILDSGSIKSGQLILVSYSAIENFEIVYTTNGLLQDVQTQVDEMKHACADAIAKNGVENQIDIVATIIPNAGVTNLTKLTSEIRTAVANFVTQLDVGVSLTQSDVITVINSVQDVDYVVVPFLKMVKTDGSLIVRDDIGNTQFEVFNEGVSTSYITTASVLTYTTVDKGGPENLHRGIFENNMPLVLQADPLDVSGGAGRGYIQSDGKLVISTRDGALPDSKEYQVDYYAQGEEGSEDINVASIEYLNIGTFSITYDSPREQTNQSF